MLRQIGHYEHRSQPLLERHLFVRRMLNHGMVASMLLALSLAIGVLGYHIFEGLSWIDSLVEASMILGGMGPVNQLHTIAGKHFAACYALYSGVAFLANASVILAPIAHRLLHRLHMERSPKSAGRAYGEPKQN
jgi:hypothetical protein